jgi:hypothetical protein
MGACWPCVHCAVYIAAVLGTSRYVPVSVIRIVAAFTRDEQRHRRCMDVLRVSQPNRSDVPAVGTESDPLTDPDQG